MRTHEHSWPLKSTHEQLLSLRSTQEYGSMVPWALLRAHECSWHPGAMIMSDHEHSYGLIRTQECRWALISAHEWSWHHRTMLIGAHGWTWAFMSIHDHSWALISGHEHSFSWSRSVTKLISMHENKWALRQWAMSTQGSVSTYDTIFMSSHECSWALMSAHECSVVLMGSLECSWVILNAQVLDSVMNIKMLTFRITSL